jgi:hypothetical protein
VPGSTSDVEGRVFHGTIREDAESGDIVELDHELKVADGEDQNSHSGRRFTTALNLRKSWRHKFMDLWFGDSSSNSRNAQITVNMHFTWKAGDMPKLFSIVYCMQMKFVKRYTRIYFVYDESRL